MRLTTWDHLPTHTWITPHTTSIWWECKDARTYYSTMELFHLNVDATTHKPSTMNWGQFWYLRHCTCVTKLELPSILTNSGQKIGTNFGTYDTAPVSPNWNCPQFSQTRGNELGTLWELNTATVSPDWKYPQFPKLHQ